MENNEQDFINIINATENNLKHISLKIPKNKSQFLPEYPVRESLLFVWIRLRQNREGN